jgi:cystathionine gamma-lyase
VCAESLGGVESLIELPCGHDARGPSPRRQRAALGIDDGLIRISVGLEAERR